MTANGRYWIGLVASVLVALAGQAEILPEPWRHYVSVGGILGTAISGYLIQRPAPNGDTVKPRWMPPA